MQRTQDFLSGGGEMGSLMRAHDWNASPLGLTQAWPELLKSTLRIMLSSNHPMFIWWGPELIQFYNDAYRQTLGPERHPAALGQPGRQCWEEIWHIIGPELNAVMTEGVSTWHEESLVPVTRHGRREEVWWTYGFSPLRDERAVHGVLVICSDVTQQRLMRRRQWFQLALADRLRPLCSPEDIILAASELVGRHLDVSRVVFAEVNLAEGTFFPPRDWTQHGLENIPRKTRRLDDFGAEVIKMLCRGEIVAVEDMATDAKTAGEAHNYAALGVRSHMAIPLVKEGALVAILGLHRSTPSQWTDDDRHTAQDMAERTWAAVETARAQAELSAERDHSAYVLNTMTEGFAVIDGDWNIVQMNAEGLRLAGRGREEVMGRNHWAVFSELDGTPLRAMYEDVKRTGVAKTTEVDYRYANAAAAWIEVRTYRAQGGCLACFFRDVSWRKDDEQKLKDADRRKDEFLAMLAHELRNPLAPISAAAELLRRAPANPALVGQASGIISRQVGHLTSLIDDLMDVSRVTRGLVTFNKEVLDARRIIAEAVEQSRPLIDARRHRLAINLTPDSAHVFGDAKRLVQVLANVLNNAAKYTPEGGAIAIALEVDGGQVVLKVSDNGIGMKPEMALRVFELFAQAERTSDRRQGGLGIGLALVKSLVELHQGSVAAGSAGAGQGSEFTIRLPREAQPTAGPPLRSAGPAAGPGKRLRLLVVDDNGDAAETLAMFLESLGHEVFVENSSRGALERAGVEQPDVCLLDLGLPEMDGHELAARLRAAPATAKSVLIAVTGYGQDQDRRKAADAGFAHHFVKPVDTRRLAVVLDGLAAI